MPSSTEYTPEARKAKASLNEMFPLELVEFLSDYLIEKDCRNVVLRTVEEKLKLKEENRLGSRARMG